MRYVVYLRVSTDSQADAGYGLEIQEQACREWLRSGRHRLVEVCTDAGRSGTLDVGHRPGLAHALALVGVDRADGVLVYRLDRLARDLILQEQVLAELHKRGKQLASCDPTENMNLTFSPDDPTRALVRRMLGSIAAYEREVIRLRLMAGRARKKLEGGYAGGPPPFGFVAVRGALVQVAEEQKVIGQMRRMRKAGLSYQAIADALEADGVQSRASHGKWRTDTIRGILLRDSTGRKAPRDAATPSGELLEASA